MGFIGKGGKAKNRNNHTTVIAQGTEIRGELMLDAKLHVDGVIRGDVRSKTDLSVGVDGQIEGSIVARNIVICGSVSGNIDCDALEIMPTGRLFGEVVSRRFVIDPGGQFSGDNRLRSEDEPLALEFRDPDTQAAGRADPPRLTGRQRED